MQDEEIIEYILRGRTELYAELIERYKSKLYSTVYNYTHDHEEAKDLTQEIFIKVYNSLGSFKNKSQFSTWFYRIAVNKCIDWSRKKRLNTVAHITCEGEEERDIFDYIADETNNPESTFVQKEHISAIREIVKTLPEMYSTVLIMYYFEDFSPQEIADILEIPRKTVDTRLYRARNLMKLKLLQASCGGEQFVLQQG